MVSLVPGMMLAIVTWAMLWPGSLGPLNTAVAVRDYLNLWAAGTLARRDAFGTLFHPVWYDGWLKSVFGPSLPLHTWSYPPTTVLLAVPLSMLPLLPGFLAWAAGGMAVLGGVLRGCRLSWWTCLAILTSPAVIENALAGQNGALTASLLEGGLLLVDRRPVLAGILFGLLTTKPHLGLLVPVCLLAAGRWRAIASAALTALSTVGVSVAAFGLDSWAWYLTDTRQFMTSRILHQPFGAAFQAMMATPFILARWAGLPLPGAYLVQGTVTAGCAMLAWAAWHRPDADPKARMALTAALALLATPYGFSYDAVGATTGVAVLASLARSTRFHPSEAALLAAAWLWPGCAFWLGLAGMPPVGCLCLTGVAWCAWRRLGPVHFVSTTWVLPVPLPEPTVHETVK